MEATQDVQLSEDCCGFGDEQEKLVRSDNAENVPELHLGLQSWKKPTCSTLHFIFFFKDCRFWLSEFVSYSVSLQIGEKIIPSSEEVIIYKNKYVDK